MTPSHTLWSVSSQENKQVEEKGKDAQGDNPASGGR